MTFLLKFLIMSVCAILTAFIWRDTFETESLRGARVLVTGASTGIGEQMAYYYARFGAQIIITARRENVLLQVAEKCLSMGAQKVLYISGDMAEQSDPARVVRFAVDKLGGLDYLVLNHIGSSPFAMWDGDVEHTRWLLQVNFLSYIQMTSAALPSLKQSGGSIIVVSSLLGKMSTPFAAPYTATKFALNGFFGTMYHELAMQRANVSLTICTLGLIDTESAMEKVRGYTNITAYPAAEAALQIIKAGALRQREVFYPWFTFYVTLIKDWFPFFTDLIIQNFYSYEP
ncbi:hydroxysteroid 11-beta-dehydrogenase 1-like protein [Megalops cyprinoides]|uniref:hydroxysteroid 11-beta-dehydrogenase 1-like protein n=1 Tax=Megalops cyprinoides TaxID=118141 RepID=UPI001863EFC6|nr:hydroxysteroid 11-beta-dehydrogenase 1-like protein [Megalops cyprinoides]